VCVDLKGDLLGFILVTPVEWLVLPRFYEGRILLGLGLRTEDCLLCRVDDDEEWAECCNFRVDELLLTGQVDLSCIPILIQPILLDEREFLLGTGRECIYGLGYLGGALYFGPHFLSLHRHEKFIVAVLARVKV